MDTADLHPMLDDLAGNIDDLEESLAPLLNNALSASTSKLPLLDKAKLYVLVTYAIESLLFSYLRLNGTDAKNHPVFRELTRVKQYFEKIKLAESAGVKRNTTLDKDAAGRFVKHALAGNEKYNRERAEQMEREKAGAKRKFEDMTERVGSHIRFENMAKKMKADDDGGLVQEEPSSDSEEEEAAQAARAGQSTRKSKIRRSKLEQADVSDPTTVADGSTATSETDIAEKAAKRQKSHVAPKAASEAFQALLKGPIPKQEGGKRSKKKRKSRGERARELEDKRAKEMM